MLGAIIGDIVGSRFEWNNHRSKEFEFLHPDCFFTDDSVLSLAVAKAILEAHPDYTDLSAKTVSTMQELGQTYPNRGYGTRFYSWLMDDHPLPYNSFGNGSAMRVSAAGFAASSCNDAKFIAAQVTKVTHNHPEGMKGAEATAVAVYLAKSGYSIPEIRETIETSYYPLNFTLSEIRDTYTFNETCQKTVPQAIEAFLESNGFEDAIRNAISVGGDSDTLAAITGGIAEAYYGIPASIRTATLPFLDTRLSHILEMFEQKYPSPIERNRN